MVFCTAGGAHKRCRPKSRAVLLPNQGSYLLISKVAPLENIGVAKKAQVRNYGQAVCIAFGVKYLVAFISGYTYLAWRLTMIKKVVPLG